MNEETVNNYIHALCVHDYRTMIRLQREYGMGFWEQLLDQIKTIHSQAENRLNIFRHDEEKSPSPRQVRFNWSPVQQFDQPPNNTSPAISPRF